VTFETLKLFTISSKTLGKHIVISPKAKEIFMEYYHRKQNYCVVLGHYGNWEWANSGFSVTNPSPMYGVYHELSNPYFDKLVIHMRSRHGTHVMEMRETVRVMMAHRNELMVGGFIADQTPPPEGAYWTTFLNQDTPVFRGTEKIARKLNYPVVFVNVKRLRRGYYEMEAEKISEESSKLPEGEITERHTRALEREIIKEPAYWLWSHRRWKHKRPVSEKTDRISV
jgi:KDO2-lipid IV(A) lauroyltransferase